MEWYEKNDKAVWKMFRRLITFYAALFFVPLTIVIFIAIF